MATYAELLKHPKWQRKRLEILERDDFRCQWCGDKEKTLHVHHIRYRKGAKPWEYPDDELRCLCEDCHKQSHVLRERLDYLIGRLYDHEQERVIGYITALILMSGDRDELLGMHSGEEATGISDLLRVKYETVIENLDAGAGVIDTFDLRKIHEAAR